jgi:SAM-dependent methyltransferase
VSETNKHRDIFLPFCVGNGLDIGFGGTPIVDTAICFDLPEGKRYSFVGESPQHLSGSADDLYMFKDNSLDYVYSSHLIEDFEDTKKVLEEWLRVIKHNGYLCLLFPDEQTYRCRSKTHNSAHKHLFFGLHTITKLMHDLNAPIVLAKQLFGNNDYNCAVIVRKEE